MRRCFRDRFEALDRLVTPNFIRLLALEQWGGETDAATSLALSEADVRSEPGAVSRLAQLLHADADWLSVGAAVVAGCALGYLVGARRLRAAVGKELLPRSS
jgi:hypothetical protein